MLRWSLGMFSNNKSGDMKRTSHHRGTWGQSTFILQRNLHSGFVLFYTFPWECPSVGASGTHRSCPLMSGHSGGSRKGKTQQAQGPKILNPSPLQSQSTAVHLDPDLPKNKLISGLTIYLIYTRTAFSLSTFYLVWQDLIFLSDPSDPTLCWATLHCRNCSS